MNIKVLFFPNTKTSVLCYKGTEVFGNSIILCESFAIFFPLTKQDTKCPLALDKKQTCLVGRKSSQISKLELLQYEPMSVSRIFPFGKKNPVGLRSRNPAGFDSIDLLMCSSQISRRILHSCTFTKSVFQHRSLPQFGSHHPRTGLLLPL